METEKHCFIQILKIKNVELWKNHLGHTTIKEKGDFTLLHSQTLDLFVLRLGDFTWTLQKSLQVIGTHNTPFNWHSYTFPTAGGFYMLKLLGPEPDPAVVNFETILKTRTAFIRNDGLVDRLSSFHDEHSKVIRGIKEGFLTAVDVIGRTLTPTERDKHPNHTLVRAYDDLINLESHGEVIADLPINEIDFVREEVSLVVRDHQDLGIWKELYEAPPEYDLLERPGYSSFYTTPLVTEKTTGNLYGEPQPYICWEGKALPVYGTPRIEKNEESTYEPPKTFISFQGHMLPIHGHDKTKIPTEPSATIYQPAGTTGLKPVNKANIEMETSPTKHKKPITKKVDKENVGGTLIV